ncbi:universal stress protein [Halalkalicoccus tibetensis]|uniref:Universal stress protein n=1 Tax=Halalkalicoccus tibetensis TaxID=175632 RepID=A0ABD5UYZ6_9EURY
MATALVVQTGDSIDNQLLEAAATYARGTDTDVVLCLAFDKKRIQNDLQRRARPDRTLDELQRVARENAESSAKAAFGEEVPYTIREEVGSLPAAVIELADELGSEHLFVSGKRRSPAGKAIFGDVAQSLILDFDGPVTVLTA